MLLGTRFQCACYSFSDNRGYCNFSFLGRSAAKETTGLPIGRKCSAWLLSIDPPCRSTDRGANGLVRARKLGPLRASKPAMEERMELAKNSPVHFYTYTYTYSSTHLHSRVHTYTRATPHARSVGYRSARHSRG